MRRKYLLAGQAVVLLLLASTLYLQGHRLTQFRLRPFGGSENSEGEKAENAASPTATTSLSPTSPPSPSLSPSSTPSLTLSLTPSPSPTELPANITRFVDAIFDPELEDPPRLACPRIADSLRYSYLKSSPSSSIDYFFAIDLRDVVDLLPRLLGSVVEVIRFLGPARCALSIIEGNSHDGTYAVLDALRPRLDTLTTTYYLRSSDLDPHQGDRIAKLAALRNLAVQPLLDEPAYGPDTTVVFLNDVAACPEDVLELVHQRRALAADMTCGLDWVYVGPDPTFYDVWIARGMTGDSFFHIPDDGNWNSAWNLFWNDPQARNALNAHRPFQVFACWNGAAVFSARPLLENGIRFRAPGPAECSQGEPQLFCKDLWHNGYRKIAVVPSVNLEYSDAQARKIKDLKGYTSQHVALDAVAAPDETSIDWQHEPPEKVKCMPTYDNQTFQPWDEGL